MDTPTYESFRDWLLGKDPKKIVGKIRGPGVSTNCPLANHAKSLGIESVAVSYEYWRLDDFFYSKAPQWVSDFVGELALNQNRWVTASQALAVLERVGR